MQKLALNHEGKCFNIIKRDYEEYHGITSAIITMNEEKDIVGLIEHVRPIVDRIVMVDGGSTDDTVNLAEPLVDALKIIPFNGHFGEQKNNALKMCYTDWVLFLDPDERLTDKVHNKIRDLIEQDEYDCYSFPRKEIRDGVEDKDVYPDYQRRLFRTYCRYIRPVHEELVGYKEPNKLEENDDLDIIHKKPQSRHDKRNSSYRFFQAHYAHEEGEPGKQLEDTVEPIEIQINADKEGEDV